MAVVLFWEKPGCASNAKQKAWLRASGHTVVERNLLTERWDAATLAGFFGQLPVPRWFNPSAPAIKRGAVVPAELDSTTAIASMLQDPLLIRRPLLQVDDQRRIGFDPEEIRAWIGLSAGPGSGTDPEACSHEGRATATREACP